MKLIKRLLFTVIIFTLLICSLDAKEETKYKYYKIEEENVHFEKEPENICEYFEIIDYDTFYYSDSYYSVSLPEDILLQWCEH